MRQFLVFVVVLGLRMWRELTTVLWNVCIDQTKFPGSFNEGEWVLKGIKQHSHTTASGSMISQQHETLLPTRWYPLHRFCRILPPPGWFPLWQTFERLLEILSAVQTALKENYFENIKRKSSWRKKPHEVSLWRFIFIIRHASDLREQLKETRHGLLGQYTVIKLVSKNYRRTPTP